MLSCHTWSVHGVLVRVWSTKVEGDEGIEEKKGLSMVVRAEAHRYLVRSTGINDIVVPVSITDLLRSTVQV